jgi:hypothetical protein
MVSRKTMMAGAMMLGAAGTSQAALMTYDVRVATTGNSPDVIRLDSKHVTVKNIGDVVKLELYAILDDGSLDGVTTNDGVSAAGGSFKSLTGGLLGALGGGAIDAAFKGTGWSNGTSQDLDADTDNDLGSASTASTTAYYIARTGNGSSPVAGTELLLGTATFTVGNLASAGTAINFTPAALSTGTALSQRYHKFTIDGTAYESNGTTVNPSYIGAGAAVIVNTVPEPASMGFVGALAVGFLAPRRPRRRAAVI